MSSPLVQALTHRGLWIAMGAGLAAWTALRQARLRRQRYERLVAVRATEDREGEWAELVALRGDEALFARFRSLVEARANVDVLQLLPGDVVGEVIDTGRALRRLIHELEGALDCALPPAGPTEKMTLEEWFRIVARNAGEP